MPVSARHFAMRPARRNMCCSSLQAAGRQRFAIPCATPHSQHRTLDEPSIRQQVDLCELALASTDLVSISSRRTTCSLLPLPLSVPSIAASVRFSIVATSKRDFLQNTALYAHQAEVCRNKRGWVSRQGHERRRQRRRPRRRECRLGSSAHMCALQWAAMQVLQRYARPGSLLAETTRPPSANPGMASLCPRKRLIRPKSTRLRRLAVSSA